ncbi:MAG: hypothetical protein K0S74_1621 [Chlamydiales bacterium]|nr:hypothetical protein [Chlamydiales bacterium]
MQNIDAASLITITQEEFQLNSSSFQEKILQATKEGVCYIEYPAGWDPLVAKTAEFANKFYSDETYTSIKGGSLGPFGGYHDRESNGLQIESFYADKPYWDVYPKEVALLAENMTQLSLKVLKASLKALNIPDSVWKQGTGKVLEGCGQYHFSLNHYRPELDEKEGLPAHKDFGQISLLYINKLGLQVNLNGIWQDVIPKKDCFIVNFAKSFESFINNSDKANAVLHRVRKITEEGRISFGAFVDNAKDAPLVSLIKRNRLEVVYAKGAEAYAKEEFEKGYTPKKVDQ